MFCKKCGTEQRDGHKYCPKCGTPYIEKDASNEDAIPANIQIDETSNQSIPNDTSSITPQRDKTYRRFAKVGMWIIIVAIVLTFVRAGFGFSFWWYVYLIIFAIVAMSLWGMTLPDSNDKVKTFDSNDVSAIKIVSCIGAIMLVILYLCGPLNSNYTISHSEERRNSSESYEQSMNDSYKQLETSFSNEQDVRMYLCSHRFASNDGYTLSFSNNANEVSLNGQQLSSYVEIRSVSSSSAVVRAQGPYGNTTFRLSVSGSGGVIEDTNDGGMYYSK